MARRWLLLLGLLLALLGGQARADNCSITPSDIVFPSVSSISGSDVFAAASFQVTCTWTDFLGGLLTPNVTVCLNLGAGSNSSTTVTAPRQLGNGSLKANYNIYTDASYAAAKIWGGWAGTSTASTPITFQMTKTGGLGSLSQTIPLYAKLTADATLAANAVGADNLTVSSTFGAGSAVMQYQFSLLGVLGCALPQTVAIPFQVRAALINDCNINAGSLVFPNASLLSSAMRTSANLTVRCSNSTAYKIVFSAGGNASSMTARRMRNASTNEMVAYQISSSLDGPSLGDGSGGTVVMAGTGDGTSKSLTVFGLVPPQTTPSPGDYKDTVTATVLF